MVTIVRDNIEIGGASSAGVIFLGMSLLDWIQAGVGLTIGILSVVILIVKLIGHRKKNHQLDLENKLLQMKIDDSKPDFGDE